MSTALPPNPEQLLFAVIATDVVVLTFHDGNLFVRLMPVNRPPSYTNIAGLPGGLIKPEETTDQAVERIIEEKSGLTAKNLHFEQLYTFSRVDRDPRGRVVAVAYLALVPWDSLSAIEQTDTDVSWWSPVNGTSKLAYDHDEVLALALARLRARLTYTTIIQRLLPPTFTLTEFEYVYNTILDTTVDRRNFRKKILKLGILTPLNEKRTGEPSRPAQLYTFASKRIETVEIL